MKENIVAELIKITRIIYWMINLSLTLFIRVKLHVLFLFDLFMLKTVLALTVTLAVYI